MTVFVEFCPACRTPRCIDCDVHKLSRWNALQHHLRPLSDTMNKYLNIRSKTYNLKDFCSVEFAYSVACLGFIYRRWCLEMEMVQHHLSNLLCRAGHYILFILMHKSLNFWSYTVMRCPSVAHLASVFFLNVCCLRLPFLHQGSTVSSSTRGIAVEII